MSAANEITDEQATKAARVAITCALTIVPRANPDELQTVAKHLFPRAAKHLKFRIALEHEAHIHERIDR